MIRVDFIWQSGSGLAIFGNVGDLAGYPAANDQGAVDA